MNLLGNNAPNAETLKDEILRVLNGIGVTPAERQAAESFFDFSKELDLSQLDKLESREFLGRNYNESYDLIDKMKKNKLSDALNRYALFIDALMGCFALYALERYDHAFFTDYITKSIGCSEWLINAYKIRYSEEEIEFKICTYAAQKYGDSFCDNTFFKRMSDYDLLAMYNASDKKIKFSSSLNPRLKLYSLSLAYSFPHKGKNAGSFKEHQPLPKEVCDDMIGYITDVCFRSVNDVNEEFIFSTVLPSLFIVLSYRKECEESFLQKVFNRQTKDIVKAIGGKIIGKEEKFLDAMLSNLPVPFFDSTVDLLFDVGGFGKNEELVTEMIKTAVTRINDRDRANVLSFFVYCAEHYPKLCLEVMYLPKEIKKSVPVVSGKNIRVDYYCEYYDILYKHLSKVYPRFIEENGIDYKKDMLKVFIETEKVSSDIAADEIGMYLSGQAELSILEPYFDQLRADLHHKRYWDDPLLLEGFKELYPELADRFFTLKAIQYEEYIKNRIERSIYGSKTAKCIEEMADAFIKAGLPVRYRFSIYELVGESYCGECYKQAIKDSLLRSMLSHKEQVDGEYKTYCPKGGVFTRNMYIRYLAESASEQNDFNRSELMAVFSDSSKAVRNTLTEVLKTKTNYESDVSALLKSKKATVREAAVDVLVSWGAEKYKDILVEAAENEKSVKLADKIRALVSDSVLSSNNAAMSAKEIVEQLHKGGKSKNVSWLYTTPNEKVHFKNGIEADDKYMQAVMLCYCGKKEFGVSREAALLAEDLKEDELNAFAVGIMSKWLEYGAEAKKKWVLNFASVHGGDRIVEVFMHYIKQWADNMRGAIAADAVKALAMNGGPLALMSVDSMAHKFKQKQVKKAANEALENAAKALGLTSEELADKIVPDLGFNEQMEQIFDYGTRKFKVYLTPALELEVFDKNDKKLKNLPSPGKKDDEELAPKANAAFKAMKKQLKSVVSIQKVRLENALSVDRRWDKAAWEALFVKNPVMHSFAIGLIWAAYENGETVQTFRYMEDGSFNTYDEDEYELPEKCEIGLVHPIELEDDVLKAWKEQLDDYEIIQPLEQLTRPVYRLTDEESGRRYLDRFDGRDINGMSLIGRTTKYGWQKGGIGDAGFFYAFYKEDIIRSAGKDDGSAETQTVTAEFNFEGMYVGGDDGDVKAGIVRFYLPENKRYVFGSYEYDRVDDEKAIVLGSLSPRYVSEIIYQLEMITKGTTE